MGFSVSLAELASLRNSDFFFFTTKNSYSIDPQSIVKSLAGISPNV